MADKAVEVPTIYLQPGEFHLAHGPAVIKTILGSCVGVSFWSPRLGIGALCHGILPKCHARVDGTERYRYVDFAIRDLARQFDALGAARTEVQIKVFGGADVIVVDVTDSRRISVGCQNWNIAL